MEYEKYMQDEKVGAHPWLWMLLFGPFYLMYRGMWKSLFIYILLALPTIGLVFPWYVFNIRKYITRHLFRKGAFVDVK